MSQLHAYFHLRNQQAFKRLLDGTSARGKPSATLSRSGGKSWNRRSPLSSLPALDVNARDWLGRTVLHLAAASQDSSATEYVRLLLAHPDVNVNLRDAESRWTALHRALYNGNLATAVLLLQHADIDTSLRDPEGYSAFDLYNSTVETTERYSDDTRYADLFTWGANRNAALGLGNGDDRMHPEQVVIRSADVSEKESVEARFSPIHVREVAMSKLHTVTAEDKSNLRVCGFGSGGRLGPGQHTQYNLSPLPQLTHTIVSVALGQDHTLAVTKSGEVLSWGLNRFSQLGYVIEPPTNTVGLGRSDEPIQATARKVAGALKNKSVQGVAACKTASACWTSREVFTWGTNNGQLGYDKSAHPVQILPRVVTKVSQPVRSVTITDTAMACLLDTNDVICLRNDGHFKVNFPAYTFPSEIAAYRPPQATNNASIEKITSCDSTFAALSSSGEVFTFSVPAPLDVGAGSLKPRVVIAPQRVWALRKKFSAVKDVALGADGSIIICTESGHVFVRARNLKAGQGPSAKTFKFQQVAYVQRVVRVCANATGAYGALRIDYRPQPIKVVGHLIAEDLAEIQPYMCIPARESSAVGTSSSAVTHTHSPHSEAGFYSESDDEGEDSSIQQDIKQLNVLCTVLERITESRQAGIGLFDGIRVAHGADLMVQVQSAWEFPAHRVMLAARCPVLAGVLFGGPSLHDHQSKLVVKTLATKMSSKLTRIGFSGAHPMSVLILLVYLYSDDVLSVWDRRVGFAIETRLTRLKIQPVQIKTELQALARLLDLPLLAQAVDAPVKRQPLPSMTDDMRRLFDISQTTHARKRSLDDPLAPDVILRLSDKEVCCHSTVLRARTPFFAAFFDDDDWTVKRWTADGTIVIDLVHLRWREMAFLVHFLCCGADAEMFQVLCDVRSVDELLDLMFAVMAAANELLIDRLMLLCSQVILKQISMNKACSILSDASHYNAMPLVRAVHDYMAANMETALESRMLDDMAPNLLKQLAAFVRQQQALKYPVARSDKLIDRAMEAHRDWLEMQDIPDMPINRDGVLSDSPKLSPLPDSHRKNSRQLASLPSSPVIRPQRSTGTAQTVPADDEVFVMDELNAPIAPAGQSVTCRPDITDDGTRKSVGGWKAISSAPRVDMRAIMAEAQTSMTPKSVAAPPSISHMSSFDASITHRGTPPKEQSKTSFGSPRLPRTPSDSPWRLPKAGTSAKPLGDLLSTVEPGSGGPVRTASPASVSGLTGSRPPAQTPPRKAAGPPNMGPVITPSKQPRPSKGSPSTIRRVSSGSVWTLPPVQPVVQSSSSGSAMSFAAIQQLQLEQGIAPVKDKRSLVQIQEEERARQVEEDFLQWWAAEEARLNAEEQKPIQTARPQKPKKLRTSKGKHITSGDAKDNNDDVQGHGKKTRKNRRVEDSARP